MFLKDFLELNLTDNFINLLDYRNSCYSHIGNDGIIKYIFDKINIKKGSFVEFGAWDGEWNSNCRKLFENGWGGIFIESDLNNFNKLVKKYDKYKRITCLNSYIGLSGNKLFDNVVKPYVNNDNIDFCSIDIDGLDLEVFETFERYCPTVICIEGGQMLHPYHKKISKVKAKHNIQQSLKIMTNIFEKKGYRVLCSYQDSFFIKQEFYSFFNVSSDLLTLYFNGLRAIPRRMPFIQKYTSKVGLRNNIIDYILKRSNYKKYGWKERKNWIKEQINIVNILINKKEIDEKKKIEKC